MARKGDREARGTNLQLEPEEVMGTQCTAPSSRGTAPSCSDHLLRHKKVKSLSRTAGMNITLHANYILIKKKK